MTVAGAGDRPLLLLLSGPNLQLFGEREPEIYGSGTLAERVEASRLAASRLGCEVEHHQSDSESELIALVHGARARAAAIVVNPGALSHYGWSLHDALATFEGPIVELHVSNPWARDAWRARSVVSPVADGVVAGFGSYGYEIAVESAIRLLRR
ncbi:MAG: type II 3-dehydroquinate dehydratase [Acidimicrobiales bacterium]